MRFLPLLVFALILSPLRAAEVRAWERWNGCTHLADQYYDGDSFQVKHAGKTYVLRLYGADTPETDAGYGARIDEQAASFGVKPADVLRSGESSKTITARFLSKPFTVITRRQVAPGASRAERIYALVERDGVALDVALLEAGFARVSAEVGDYPDAAGEKRRESQLRVLEQKAARDRRGLWAKSTRAGGGSLLDRLTPRIFKPAAPVAPRKVNLNTASAAELESLPGIGPKTAEQIIRARPLAGIEALDALNGFGPKRIEALRDLVSF